MCQPVFGTVCSYFPQVTNFKSAKWLTLYAERWSMLRLLHLVIWATNSLNTLILAKPQYMLSQPPGKRPEQGHYREDPDYISQHAWGFTLVDGLSIIQGRLFFFWVTVLSDRLPPHCCIPLLVCYSLQGAMNSNLVWHHFRNGTCKYEHWHSELNCIFCIEYRS